MVLPSALPAPTTSLTYVCCLHPCFRFVAVPESIIAPKPRNLSFEEAASLPLVGHTGYQALVDLGQVTKGSKVMVLGASGGTGASVCSRCSVCLASWPSTSPQLVPGLTDRVLRQAPSPCSWPRHWAQR